MKSVGAGWIGIESWPFADWAPASGVAGSRRWSGSLFWRLRHRLTKVLVSWAQVRKKDDKNNKPTRTILSGCPMDPKRPNDRDRAPRQDGPGTWQDVVGSMGGAVFSNTIFRCAPSLLQAPGDGRPRGSWVVVDPNASDMFMFNLYLGR